jgi:hypothetical protein
MSIRFMLADDPEEAKRFLVDRFQRFCNDVQIPRSAFLDEDANGEF